MKWKRVKGTKLVKDKVDGQLKPIMTESVTSLHHVFNDNYSRFQRSNLPSPVSHFSLANNSDNRSRLPVNELGDSPMTLSDSGAFSAFSMSNGLNRPPLT